MKLTLKKTKNKKKGDFETKIRPKKSRKKTKNTKKDNFETKKRQKQKSK